MLEGSPDAGRTSRVGTAAALLIEARRHRQLLAAVPFGLRDVDEAYAIQDAVAGRLGAVTAWKVGAKGPAETPTCAPVLGGLLHESPAVLPARHFGMIGIEAELAFRLGRDVPAADDDIGDEAIAAAIATVHPAIEVVDTRLAEWRQADKLWLLADNQMNGGLVYGSGAAARQDLDLKRQPVRLLRDGGTLAEAVGGNPAGDPWRLVGWLVNHCRRRRGGLKAGTMITTGSCTGMIFVEPGARMQAEFPGIGSVDVEFPR
jgi:2-keto-4-pentenoate hydratase